MSHGLEKPVEATQNDNNDDDEDGDYVDDNNEDETDKKGGPKRRAKRRPKRARVVQVFPGGKAKFTAPMIMLNRRAWIILLQKAEMRWLKVSTRTMSKHKVTYQMTGTCGRDRERP
jgi:hypothetical protein